MAHSKPPARPSTKNNYYLGVERRHGKQIVRTAAGHNTREDYAATGAPGNIDPARTPSNLILRGPQIAKDIARLATTLMAEAGVGALRKDAVTMLEVLFSLPADSTIDARTYFDDCTRWAEQHFDVPVLSSIVHLDEAAPHCHLLLLPLRDGCMVGSRLYGNRAKLSARQYEFYKAVAQPHGLARQVAPPRLSANAHSQAIALLLSHLSANLLTADQLTYLLAPHQKDLGKVLDKFGLATPTDKPTTSRFVEIMTKPQKPNGFACLKPNGFQLATNVATDRNRTWDGFGSAATSF